MKNNSYLKEKFMDTYKDFFLHNNLVLSGNHVLAWTPWFTHWLPLCKIKQKIPSKSYCWIRFTQESKIYFNELLTISYQEDKFKTTMFNEFYKVWTKIEKFVQDYLQKNWFDKWVSFNFLTEKPKWQWFSSFSVFGVLIATTLLIILWKLDYKLLNNYEAFKKSDSFNEVIKLSNQIIAFNSTNESFGSNTLCILQNEQLPLVFLNDSIKVRGIVDNPNQLNMYKLSELVGNTQSTDTLPIDYGIISFWVWYSYDEMKHLFNNMKNEYSEIQSKISINWNAEKSTSEDISWVLLNSTNLSIFKVINWFKQLIWNMYDKEVVEKFIKSINELWYLGQMYEKDYKLYMKIIYIFDMIKNYSDEDIWLIPFNIWWNSWSFLFVTKLKRSRQTIEKLVIQFKAQYPDVTLEYSSWSDGYSNEWIKVEQYLWQDIFSEYVNRNQISYLDDSSNIYIDNYDTVTVNYNKWLLLDKLKRKIYINWEPITSKQLHSQNATIEIFEILLRNIDKTITNIQLPMSSYSKNKNEFLTKIMMPLQKLIKEYYGNELDLECYWGINTFFLKLKRNNTVRIWLVDSIL